jgi:segregation and condensation protein B
MTSGEEHTETQHPEEGAESQAEHGAVTTLEETAEAPVEGNTETARERRARTAREELEAAIEAILFVATEPVATERLYALFGEDERETVDAALAAVVARYPGNPAQGLVADYAAGGVRLVTRPALQSYLRKFFQVTGRTKLSMAALETLALVAYRQPITAPEIQELRSVSSTGVLKTLLDHRLIRISGRKEVVGKPFLYSTSREFLVRFGLNRLQDLPPLEELEQMLQSQVEAEGAAVGGTQTSLDLRSDLDPEVELDRADRAEEARERARDDRDEGEEGEDGEESTDGPADQASQEHAGGAAAPEEGGDALSRGADTPDFDDEADEELAGAWLEEPTDEDLRAIVGETAQDDRDAPPPTLVDDLDLVDELDGVDDPLDLPDELGDDEVESTVAAIDWEDDDEPRSEDE